MNPGAIAVVILFLVSMAFDLYNGLWWRAGFYFCSAAINVCVMFMR